MDWNKITSQQMIEAAVITKLAVGDRDIDEVFSASRRRIIAQKRMIAMYVIERELEFSLVAIGKIFSRNHSTVISHLKKVDRDHRLHQQAISVQNAYVRLTIF